MIKTLAIIQARMGSRRLPGKMLKKIGNLTVMEWVILRILRSKKINKVILATTNFKRDNCLVRIAKKYKIGFFRGSEKDVLDRFFKAATKLRAKNIIRICGDCALIAPEELDKLVKFFYLKKCDYVCNHENKLKSRYVDGFGAEMLSYETLKKIKHLAKTSSDKQHVTTYLWKNLWQISIITKNDKYINSENKFNKLKNGFFIDDNFINI